MALTTRDRIHGARAMAEMFSRARTVPGRDVAIRTLRAGTERTTFAVIVPVAVAPHATKRNTLRRRGSECLRRILKEHPVVAGWRVIVTLRNDVEGEALSKELVSLLKKSGILQP